MRASFVIAALVAAAVPCAQAADFGGQVRPQVLWQRANAAGPLAAANALQPDLAALPRDIGAVEAELRASVPHVNAVATLRTEHDLDGGATRSSAWFDELYASGDALGWQFAAGKRIVAWDVGYAYRPNDVVEQEVRRTLLSVTPQGRPMLMAEHFDATTAWTFVLVNPTKDRDTPGADEPALAARVYRRDGAVDWHGFARWGAHTHASLGGAFAWVANESTEVHASARWLARADTLALDPAADAAPLGLASANPWQRATTGPTAQLLVGGTWTNEQQFSLLAEAWWDGSAPSDAQWDAWNARNARLAALGAALPPGVPPLAVAGNLAWQANAFGASTNLRRANLYLRASWTHEKWEPALDMLYTPADAGRIVTASIGWQGDRVRIDGGARVYGGPSGALLAQVPTRRIVYLAATWSF